MEIEDSGNPIWNWNAQQTLLMKWYYKILEYDLEHQIRNPLKTSKNCLAPTHVDPITSTTSSNANTHRQRPKESKSTTPNVSLKDTTSKVERMKKLKQNRKQITIMHSNNVHWWYHIMKHNNVLNFCVFDLLEHVMHDNVGNTLQANHYTWNINSKLDWNKLCWTHTAVICNWMSLK